MRVDATSSHVTDSHVVAPRRIVVGPPRIQNRFACGAHSCCSLVRCAMSDDDPMRRRSKKKHKHERKHKSDKRRRDDRNSDASEDEERPLLRGRGATATALDGDLTREMTGASVSLRSTAVTYSTG